MVREEDLSSEADGMRGDLEGETTAVGLVGREEKGKEPEGSLEKGKEEVESVGKENEGRAADESNVGKFEGSSVRGRGSSCSGLSISWSPEAAALEV